MHSIVDPVASPRSRLVACAAGLALLLAQGCGLQFARPVPFRPPTSQSDVATVVFVGRGGALGWTIFRDQGQFLGELGAGTWFEATMPPGPHVFHSFNPENGPSGGCTGVRAELAPGHTYYVSIRFISALVNQNSNGSAGSELAEAMADLADEGYRPGQPVPDSDIGWHWRVLRRREQVQMDPWRFLRQRQRTEGVVGQGQARVDAFLRQRPISPARCSMLEPGEQLAAGDSLQ